ncbi:hypothetical protein B0H14DRAFT_3902791 [Mycena olivaceomarginata]|nr:hypothetical protein B0H14DRAFT_3902791 [Mycena olivaceomarginata]
MGTTSSARRAGGRRSPSRTPYALPTHPLLLSSVPARCSSSPSSTPLSSRPRAPTICSADLPSPLDSPACTYLGTVPSATCVRREYSPSPTPHPSHPRPPRRSSARSHRSTPAPRRTLMSPPRCALCHERQGRGRGGGGGWEFARRRGWCRARGASARSTSSRWTRPRMCTPSTHTVELSPWLAKGHSEERDMDERGADRRDTGSALKRARINDAESTPGTAPPPQARTASPRQRLPTTLILSSATMQYAGAGFSSDAIEAVSRFLVRVGDGATVMMPAVRRNRRLQDVVRTSLINPGAVALLWAFHCSCSASFASTRRLSPGPYPSDGAGVNYLVTRDLVTDVVAHERVSSTTKVSSPGAKSNWGKIQDFDQRFARVQGVRADVGSLHYIPA